MGGRDEQQANQPAPIWGDGWVLCVCVFCPIITVFFFFFWARIAGTKFRQQTRGHNPGHQVQTRRHDPGHQKFRQGDVQIRVTLRVWPLRQFHWEEIWLSGSDRSIPGANEIKATGRAALTLISGYARLPEGRPACRGVRRPSIREEIWLSGPVHQPPGSTGAQSCPPQEAELGPTA